VTARNLITIVVDRLHAGMVGAYGNSWIGTAALDELASQSFVFDQAFVDRPELPSLYRSYWFGRHAADRREIDAACKSLPRRLGEAGLHTALLTDEPAVASLVAAADFEERVFIEPAEVPRTAEDISQTGLARLFGAASEWLTGAREPFGLWIHVRGMEAPWDAPLAMRNRFADEDDPEPPKLVEVPNYWTSGDVDPDELLGVRHAYAGQVSLLDACLAAFLDELAELPLWAGTQLALLSARGYALGLHQRIGACDEALYNETAQLVWMIRSPEMIGGARSQALVQPSDLPGTLLGGLGQGVDDHEGSLLGIMRGDVETRRDHVVMLSQHDRAVRTAAWHLRQPIHGAAELYAKPSDRWEVNEVSKLMPEVVAGLEQLLSETENRGQPLEGTSLPELLTSEVD